MNFEKKLNRIAKKNFEHTNERPSKKCYIYNERLNYFPVDPSMHLVGIYESECELLKLKFNEPQSTTATTFKVTEFSNPTCQPDGKFHRVQKLGTKFVSLSLCFTISSRDTPTKIWKIFDSRGLL